MISAPEPLDGDEASIEQSPENQAPTPRPSLGGVETEENTLGDEKSNNGNEIITPTDDILPHEPVVAQPTLDNFVKDFPAEPPQAEGEEPGEANELVEDTAGNTGKMEHKNILKNIKGKYNETQLPLWALMYSTGFGFNVSIEKWN